jgi:hypothetical protein
MLLGLLNDAMPCKPRASKFAEDFQSSAALTSHRAGNDASARGALPR